MRLSRFFLPFFLISMKAYSGESYGVILSGGYNLENNKYRYYNSTKDMYSAFRSAGIKRDNITTLYGDGGAKGVDTVKYNAWTGFLSNDEIDTPVSLEGDGKRDIKYPATSSSISATFDDLAKKVRPGDKLVFFITDHGDKNKGVVLWGGEKYSVYDFAQELAKLPAGVMVQVATNMCFGGQLLRLTRPNVCVVANSTENETTMGTIGQVNEDSFVTNFTNAIKKPMGKTGNRASLMDAFEAGTDNDSSHNKNHLTSIDFFIEKQAKFSPETQLNISCEGQGPVVSLKKEIMAISDFFGRVNDPRKEYYEKYLKQKLKDTVSSLDSYKIQYSQWKRDRYQKDLDELKFQWASLSVDEKKKLWPNYTGLAEKLRIEDDNQRKKVEDLEADQKRALAEMRFLKNASSEQLQEYYSIRRCLEHEI